MRPDETQLILSGSAYHNWYEIDIDSDVFTPADAFSLKTKLPERQYLGLVREGASCDVYIGDDRQMAGVIDTVSISIARQKTSLQVSGRDKGAFLVDSEADTLKVSKYTLEALAQKLLKPSFGIKNVIVSNEDNRKRLLGKKDRKSSAGVARSGRSAGLFGDTPRALTKIDPGQKIAAVFDEACRRAGIAWWITASGDLFFGKPNYFQEVAFEFLLYAEGSQKAVQNNIESAEIVRAIADRYTTLTVAGQGAGTQGLFTSPSAAKGSRFKASATDPDLQARGIDRQVILTDSDTLSSSMAQSRADYEMSKRRLSGLTIQLTVPGFRDASGRIYTVDTLALVKIEEANIDGVYWVSQRRFTETRSKRRTELTLHEKGVWLT